MPNQQLKFNDNKNKLLELIIYVINFLIIQTSNLITKLIISLKETPNWSPQLHVSLSILLFKTVI